MTTILQNSIYIYIYIYIYKYTKSWKYFMKETENSRLKRQIWKNLFGKSKT